MTDDEELGHIELGRPGRGGVPQGLGIAAPLVVIRSAGHGSKIVLVTVIYVLSIRQVVLT